MHRKEILTNAITHTCGQREEDYGPPEKNFRDIAALWQTYLNCKYSDLDATISPEDVAWMMLQLKVARAFNGALNADTYEDAAAYAAIAGECAQ